MSRRAFFMDRELALLISLLSLLFVPHRDAGDTLKTIPGILIFCRMKHIKQKKQCLFNSFNNSFLMKKVV